MSKNNSLLTIKEFATAAGVSKQTIYNQLNGRLKPFVKVINDTKMLEKSALEEFYRCEDSQPVNQPVNRQLNEEINEKLIRIIPLIACIVGIVLGILCFYAFPTIISASNLLTAVLIGGSSGLSATGCNQIFKQLKKFGIDVKEVNNNDN